MTSLIARLRHCLDHHPTATAVEGDDWILSYRDLDHESGRLARALLREGVAPGQYVPLLMGRSPTLVVTLLALARCGACAVPVDTANPPARLRAMLASVDATLVLADAAATAAAPAVDGVRDVQRLLTQAPSGPLPPWPDAPGGTPLYAMFTSGSTGAPKAVVVPQRAVHRLVCGADYADFRPDARWAFASSPAFDASTLELWAPLLNGGCCVVQQRPQPSLDELAGFLTDRHISDAWLTSALFSAMVDERLDALGGLRQLLTGGERVSVAHARACLAAWPALRLINGYGPTENTTFSLCHTIVAADVAEGRGPLPIGRPIRGTEAAVMAPDGRRLPAGEVGELWVGGAGLALGYLGDEARTRRAFVEHGGQRWYRTGDLVRCEPDGVHAFLGRADRQVKIDGHRIEVEEVESALAACPGVGQAAVVLHEGGPGDRHLVGCYVAQQDPGPTDAEVHAALARLLPPTAMPRRLLRLPRLPMTLNGKVDRSVLASLGTSVPPATPAPDGDEAPRSDTERRLAALWQRHLPQAALHRGAHFLRSGGGSLLALRLVADIGRAFGRQVDPVDLLRQPLLWEHARLIDTAAPIVPAAATSTPSGARPTVPLARSQQAVVRAARLDPVGSAYLVPVALHLPRALALERLRQAFEAVARRHTLLNIAIGGEGDAVAAWRMAALPPSWWTVHAALPTAPADGRWPAALTPVVTRPLDLAVDGPMRVDAWPLPEGGHLCVWTAHHAVVDEASVDRVLEELDRLLAGEPLAPVDGAPAAFAELEQRWTDTSDLAAQASDLAGTLAGQAAVWPTPPQAGGELELPLPPETGAALARLAERWQCTRLAPVLLACGTAQQAAFGEAWRHLLTPFSRRIEPELLEPVACMLDLRLVDGGRRPGEPLAAALARVRQALLAAQQRRCLPLDRLAGAVEAIDPALRPQLTQFALTWRSDPQRPRSLGGHRVELLRVPQTSSRFGQTLHVEERPDGLHARLEFVQGEGAEARAQAFAQAFVAQLQQVAALAEVPVELASVDGPDAAPRHPARPAAPASPHRAAARSAWVRWLGAPPQDDEAHFLRAGGSSLLAMRMAATLRRETALQLDVAAFLARPRFGDLCALLGAGSAVDTGLVKYLGAQDDPRVVLVAPGLGGAVGMFGLATELHRRLPAGHAVAVVDGDALLRRAPEQDRLAFFAEQVKRIVFDLGEERIAGIVGFSAGGIVGLQLMASMDPAWVARRPLCLLDTYAPRYNARRFSTRRRLVNLLHHPRETLQRLAARWRHAHGPEADDDGDAWAMTPAHEALQDDIARATLDPRGIRATLIRSTEAARRAGVLRRRGSNGFDASRFRSLAVVPVVMGHMDVIQRGSPEVAALVASALVASAPQAHAEVPC